MTNQNESVTTVRPLITYCDDAISKRPNQSVKSSCSVFPPEHHHWSVTSWGSGKSAQMGSFIAKGAPNKRFLQLQESEDKGKEVGRARHGKVLRTESEWRKVSLRSSPAFTIKKSLLKATLKRSPNGGSHGCQPFCSPPTLTFRL